MAQEGSSHGERDAVSWFSSCNCSSYALSSFEAHFLWKTAFVRPDILLIKQFCLCKAPRLSFVCIYVACSPSSVAGEKNKGKSKSNAEKFSGLELSKESPFPRIILFINKYFILFYFIIYFLIGKDTQIVLAILDMEFKKMILLL